MNGQELASWVQAISQLLFLLFFLALFLGLNQRLQLYIWTRDIRSKLAIIEATAEDARRKTLEFLVKSGAKNPETLINRINNFFVIEPVSIEPTDIIKRLDLLVTIRSRRFKEEFERALPQSDEVVRGKAEVAAEITAALNFLYRAARHYLLMGEKMKNWILIMQLQLIMPQLVKIAETYRKALNDFLAGYPIGDAAGPLVALKLSNYSSDWKLIEWETVSTLTEIEGRKVYIVKAQGPMPTVGRPGSGVEKLVRELVARGEKPSLLLTVDAALKLEGEESGSVADGVGAAIGDIGPEKIRFERIAAEFGVPLRAVIVKMSLEEAIQAMNKKIYDGVELAIQRVRDIILAETKPGDSVIVAGIGNTGGVM